MSISPDGEFSSSHALSRCHVVALFTRKIALKCVFSCQDESHTKRREKVCFPLVKQLFGGSAPGGARPHNLRLRGPSLYAVERRAQLLPIITVAFRSTTSRGRPQDRHGVAT